MLFIVSEVELRPAPTTSRRVKMCATVTIERATGVKCEPLLALCARGVDDPRGPPVRSVVRTPWRRRSMDNALEEVVSAGRHEAADHPPRRLEVWLPMLIVAVDQATKALVRDALPVHESITITRAAGHHARAEQRGRVGILNGVDFPSRPSSSPSSRPRRSSGVGMYARQPGAPSTDRPGLRARAHHRRPGRQLIDRVLAGSVVDFVDFYWHGYHFWAFNVADSAISVASRS